MIISFKKQYTLVEINQPKEYVFNLIANQIPNSIFSKLSFLFFKKVVKKKLINCYLIKKKKKISAIITTTTFKNYKILRKEIIKYLLFSPLIVLSNFLFLIGLIYRDSNEVNSKEKNKYLHLLHLVIFKKEFLKISLKSKDNLINLFLKIIVKKNNANFFYLCYERHNNKAHKYYKRNKFVIYKRNKKTVFIKKRII